MQKPVRPCLALTLLACALPAAAAAATAGPRTAYVANSDVGGEIGRPGKVDVAVHRAVGAKPGARCPKPNPKRRYAGRLTLEPTPKSIRSASVDRRLALDLKLAPGLYRITVRADEGDGQLTRPAHRWVRVLRAR